MRSCPATILLLLSMAICGCHRQAGRAPAPSISPMRAIYVQDQRDRGELMSDAGDAIEPSRTMKAPEALSDDDMTRRDAEREVVVRSMLQHGQLITAQDFHDAAYIFQHGHTSDEYLLAHVLAVEAVARGGGADSKWIAAATLDRYLQEIGQKQVFGTQYEDEGLAYYMQHRNEPNVGKKVMKMPTTETQEPYDPGLIPAAVRKDFCVPDLEQQRLQVEHDNKNEDFDAARPAGCIR